MNAAATQAGRPPGLDLHALARRALQGPAAALQALRTRDRLLLAGATAALLIGAELLVILPLRDKRLAIEAALMNTEQDRQQALQQREQALRERDAELQSRADAVATALAGSGASAAPRESLRFLLSRTLQGLPVRVLSLRALPGEELPIPTAASADTVPAADAASAAVPPLFRHRYELQVGGSFDDLLAAIEALETQARPLRVERVRLHADEQGALQAHITLLTMGSERTWLAL